MQYLYFIIDPQTPWPSAKQNFWDLGSFFFSLHKTHGLIEQAKSSIVLWAASFASFPISKSHFLIIEPWKLSAPSYIWFLEFTHKKSKMQKLMQVPRFFAHPDMRGWKHQQKRPSPPPYRLSFLPPWYCWGKGTYPWIPTEAHPKCLRDWLLRAVCLFDPVQNQRHSPFHSLSCFISQESITNCLGQRPVFPILHQSLAGIAV